MMSPFCLDLVLLHIGFTLLLHVAHTLAGGQSQQSVFPQIPGWALVNQLGQGTISDPFIHAIWYLKRWYQPNQRDREWGRGSALKAMGGRLMAVALSVLRTFAGHSHYHQEASGCKKLQVSGGYLWLLKYTQPLCRAG